MEEQPKFGDQLSSSSVASIGGLSVASSVDDLMVEEKFQHKKKLICVAVTILIGVVVAGILFFGAHEATNGFDFPSSDKVTADMVLPNTVLTIEKISSSQSKGTITFQPYNMQFSWHSLFNNSHDFIKFKWQSDSLESEENSDYYDEYFNDISGFMIDLNGDDIDNSPSLRNESNIATLDFYIYKFDSDTIETITMNSDGNSENTLSSQESNLLNLLINGYIGQYFSELSFKLGSLQYTGDEYTSIKFIHNYGKFFYSNAGENQTANWNFTMIEEAIELTNIIVLYNGSRSQEQEQEQETEDEQQYKVNDGSSRSLLSDPECCPGGHRVGNSYSRCGNGCFGMCGRDCDCWSWVCGTCQCIDECHEHDWYCSCVSSWAFWCLNVFWVGCSDQCWWM